MKVDYEAIYKYLSSTKSKIVTASAIAYAIGAKQIYGATMAKLVRDGYLSNTSTKGFYYNHNYRY
jgi:hypothetical protein